MLWNFHLTYTDILCVYWVAMKNEFLIWINAKKMFERYCFRSYLHISHRVEKNFTQDHRYDWKIIIMWGKTTFIWLLGEQVILNWEKWYIDAYESLRWFNKSVIVTVIKCKKKKLWKQGQKWRQPKCPSTGERINKMCRIHTMDHYLAIKSNEMLIYVMLWMNFENLLSERSQT